MSVDFDTYYLGLRSDLDLHRQLILTKGDNNEVDDRSLYPPMQDYVRRSEIVGVVVAYVPGIGWPPIAFHQALQSLLSMFNARHAERT